MGVPHEEANGENLSSVTKACAEEPAGSVPACTSRLSRATWAVAPIEGESRMPEYVPALLKELAARNNGRERHPLTRPA